MSKTIHVKGKGKKQSTFQKLWQTAERHRKNNARFREALDALVQRIESTIRPVEKEAAEADKPLLCKLLTLAQRKSLAQWQRAELDYWIQELVFEMQSYALVDDALLNEMARYDAFRLGITLEEDDIAPPAEQLVEIFQREEALREAAEKEMRQSDSPGAFFDDSDFIDIDISSFFDEMDAEPEAEPVLPDAPALTNEVVQRLFRTTAAKLHPDREPDPDQREVKQKLMADLLRARKHGDIMRILELHQEHVGERQEFSKVDEQQLIVALEHNIRELENEKQDIIEQSPQHEMVYTRFYNSSKKKVDKAIAEHLAMVANDKIIIDQMVQEIRSLKALKPYLEERYDSREGMSDIDRLMDLFE